MNNRSSIIITCKALEHFFRRYASEETEIRSYDISLHVRPELLRNELQQAINIADGDYDDIYLGYALCSQSVVGLRSMHSRIILFATDDCIGIFMGDQCKQREYALAHPGTYFMCKGWIGDGKGSVFDEYTTMVNRYGQQRAERLTKKMLGHYHRLAHIVIPEDQGSLSDENYVKEKADLFGLEYTELTGTDHLISVMLSGRENSNIAVFAPGEQVSLERILATQKGTGHN